MAQTKINLTLREQMALTFAAANNYNNWREIYLNSRNKKTPNDLPSSFDSIMLQWKNQRVVKEFFQEQKERFEKMKVVTNVVSEPANQIEKTAKNRISKIDFTDRNKFIEYLSSRANEIPDDKLRADYLKMLSDNLQFKQDNSAKEKEIWRFYTDNRIDGCQNCELYKVGLKLLNKELKQRAISDDLSKPDEVSE
ncbi:MAG: hypothetical protein PHR41_09040 [Lactococcus chungangensis]|nr:hypothetical protein [Lactococcus chungangensis]